MRISSNLYVLVSRSDSSFYLCVHHHSTANFFGQLSVLCNIFNWCLIIISLSINWGVKLKAISVHSFGPALEELKRQETVHDKLLYTKRHAMDNKVLITLSVLLCCAAVNARATGATKLIFDRDLRIVGGSVARTAQFPHAVALVLHLTLQRSSFCGGSIIHPTYVLTVRTYGNFAI